MSEDKKKTEEKKKRLVEEHLPSRFEDLDSGIYVVPRDHLDDIPDLEPWREPDENPNF